MAFAISHLPLRKKKILIVDTICASKHDINKRSVQKLSGHSESENTHCMTLI